MLLSFLRVVFIDAQLQYVKFLIFNKIKRKSIQMINAIFFFCEKHILFLFSMNKNLKSLIKQNVRIITKFLSYLIKNIKHFNQDKS